MRKLLYLVLFMFIPILMFTGCNKKGSNIIAAYYPSWAGQTMNFHVSDIDASKITHLIFAFANVNEDGSVVVGNEESDTNKIYGNEKDIQTEIKANGHFRQLQALRENNPDLKILVSIGGWDWSKNFSDIAADEEKRAKFALSAAEFIATNGFDGVDIDWEFPVSGGNQIPHREADKENFTLLLKDTREALDAAGKENSAEYLLTIAASANIEYLENIEPKEVVKYVDFINVMTYDYAGSWDARTGHIAPLYPRESAKEPVSVSGTIEAYLAAGIKSKKIVMGIPFYGRGWTKVRNKNDGYYQKGVSPTTTGMNNGTIAPGVWSFSDLEENYIPQEDYERFWDETSMVPYLFDGVNWISYEDEESITGKIEYAKTNKLAGVMSWDISLDKNKTLLNAIYSAYYPEKPKKKKPNKDENQTDVNTSVPEEEETNEG